MATVTLEQVKKCYGDVEVIENLSLDVGDEEFMVLVGPSGCGKSTALRMIAGLEEITDGTISISGRIVNDVEPKDRDIAMVFQSYALYPHMTVRQNLEFGLRVRKMHNEEINRRVTEAAGILGLTEFLDRKPRHLSGGQRQRVAVGRAIVRKPQVFLFDEPLSNLDAKLRVQMRAEISGLQRRLKTTTVYVTHDQVEAMTMGHRIAVLNDGDLMQVGAPLEVYERPQNVFVARFIGTPPMNIFKAQLTDGGTLLRHPGTVLPVPEAHHAATSRLGAVEVLVGMRPENLRKDATDSAGRTARVKVKTEFIETLGHEILVHGRLGDDVLIAKLDPRNMPAVGEEIELRVEVDHLHLFDATTERRLAAQGGEG